MKLDSLHKLFVHELKDLYSAETQLAKALKKMEGAARDNELKEAFASHRKETKNHAQRLTKIFDRLKFSPGGHKCKAMAGLVAEGLGLLEEDIKPRVLDAALIAAAQRCEHYEIAGYGVARAYAEKLGDYKSAAALQQILEDEGRANRHLTRLAERSINFAAMDLKKTKK